MPAEISIIIPTLREAANLPVLAARLAAAMTGRSYEVIIVDDDSQDGTDHVIADLAGSHPIKLVTRRPPKDGLSGAVLEGFKRAEGTVLVVMDADLQHPPEKVPELVDALATHAFALGSRYTAGGGIDGKWTLFRALNSRAATLLAAPFAPGITDPMSGFFSLTRKTLDGAERLTPLGYKIALELMCKCRVAEIGGVREVPIHFAQRERGQSKLSAREQFRYLEHLSRLYDYTFPRASPVSKFLISLALGWAPAAGAFLGTHGLPAVARVAISYPLAIAVTWALHVRYVRAQREFIVRKSPWADFWLISIAEYATALVAALYLQSRVAHPRGVEVFLISCGLAAVTRYALRKELLHDIRGLRRDPRRHL